MLELAMGCTGERSATPLPTPTPQLRPSLVRCADGGTAQVQLTWAVGRNEMTLGRVLVKNVGAGLCNVYGLPEWIPLTERGARIPTKIVLEAMTHGMVSLKQGQSAEVDLYWYSHCRTEHPDGRVLISHWGLEELIVGGHLDRAPACDPVESVADKHFDYGSSGPVFRRPDGA
jgi:hypothetical protein